MKAWGKETKIEKKKLKSIHLKDRHPPCSSLWFRFVDKEGVDAETEDDVSPKEVLEALEEKVLCLQLVHEPAVDEEGDVEDNVAKETNDDQRFSSVVLKIKLRFQKIKLLSIHLWQRPCKEGEKDGWPALKQSVVTLASTCEGVSI